MNIPILTNSITIKESPFYNIEDGLLRPFIDAYFLKPDLVKDDQRCVLLKRYSFGQIISSPLSKYLEKNVDLFIGYRFLSRKYRPFYLSLSKYDDTHFEITGFSTLMDDDLIKPWYLNYITHPDFTNWNFELNVSRNEDRYLPMKNRIDSIYKSLTKIAEKTKCKNEKIIYSR